MSKASLILLTIAFLISGAWSSALAGNTISLYADTGDGLARFMSTGSEPFDIVAVWNTDLPSYKATAFVVTDLAQIVPGVFRIGVTSGFGRVSYVDGEGVTEYGAQQGPDEEPCVESGPFEVIRITYFNMGGASVANDTVLRMRAPQPGDFFPGHPDGLVSSETCDYEYCLPTPPYACRIPLAFEPWSESGMPDREDLAGAVVLNPTWLPISNETLGMSALKTRF